MIDAWYSVPGDWCLVLMIGEKVNCLVTGDWCYIQLPVTDEADCLVTGDWWGHDG